MALSKIVVIFAKAITKEHYKMEYDIFMSYRRVDSESRTSGRDIARTIKLELEKRGYSVFFDYSEIKDNEFENVILPAIYNSTVFIVVLSKDALLRCVNKEDWVRREIEKAIECGSKIIPVSPDGAFYGWPKNLPESLSPLTKQQISEISMGSLFEKSIDKLEEERIKYTINNKGNEDINLNNVKKILSILNRHFINMSQTIGISWKEHNMLTNIVACLYLIILLLLLFIFIEILRHNDKNFVELSLGFYVVTFMYGILQYLLNRRDGVYLILLSPIIVLPVGYFIYLTQTYSNATHVFDSTFFMFLFSIPFLLSLSLKKKGKSTWKHLRGGVFGLFKRGRHYLFYMWYIIWLAIVIYKNLEY